MSYDLMFQQALALHEQGRFDEAESLYRQILETAPRNPDVLNLLGLVAQAKGIHNEAVELFYKAVCEAPTHAPFYFNLALSLDLWDKPHEALDNYRKALKIDPGIKEAWNNIGTLCQKLGQAAEAETAYRRAAALDSEYAEPRVNLARMKKDLSELKALAKRFPHDALSLYFWQTSITAPANMTWPPNMQPKPQPMHRPMRKLKYCPDLSVWHRKIRPKPASVFKKRWRSIRVRFRPWLIWQILKPPPANMKRPKNIIKGHWNCRRKTLTPT